MKNSLIKQLSLHKEALQNHNATTVQFCGIHAGEFLTGVVPSFALREKLARQKSEMEGTRQEIKNADVISCGLKVRLGNGIKCHPDYGPNSALYVQAGYVAHNQRQSGLTRPAVETPPIAPLTPPSGQAAA